MYLFVILLNKCFCFAVLWKMELFKVYEDFVKVRSNTFSDNKHCKKFLYMLFTSHLLFVFFFFNNFRLLFYLGENVNVNGDPYDSL